MVAVGIRSNLTNAVTRNLDWSYAFEPSIAITTGRIDKLGLDIRSFREPLHQSVKEVMTKSIRRNFDEGGRPPWEPLSEATWRARTAKGWEGGGPLSLSGLLERTASQINIWTISATSATIRDLPSKVWYGKVHQQGAGGGSPKDVGATFKKVKGILKFDVNKTDTSSQGRGYVNIPQRQFLVIQEEDEKAIVEIFRKWLQKRVDAHVGRM